MALSELVIRALKSRYFELARLENYPETPAVTVELDELEKAIREHQ